MLTLKTENKNNTDYINITNDNLFISKEAWLDLNTNYTKEEIKQAISNAIEQYQIPVPKDLITLEEAKQDFDKLKELDATTLLKSGKTFTRYDYKWEISDTYIDDNNVYYKYYRKRVI